MRDVAERANVSIQTVSRVVNHETGVSPETVERVRTAISQLRYRPDARAQGMRARRTHVIGVVLVDVANPFYASVLRGVEDEARGHGYLVLGGSSSGSPARETSLVRALLAQRVDGLVLAPTAEPETALRQEIAAGPPIVTVDHLPDPLLGDAVLTDHRAGAAAAVEQLIANGHQRIAFLGDDPALYATRERLRGWRESLTGVGLPHDDGLVRTGLGDVRDAADAVDELLALPDPPTALFTAVNVGTLGALRALHAVGRAAEVALIGFDDVDLADVLQPRVTVVPQDAASLGRIAARRLLTRLDGEDGPPTVQLVPTGLVRRGSGEILRTRPGSTVR